jgi:hypothetical protein
MKNDELIPQYLQDEIREINNIRPPYSYEDMTRLKDLFDYTLEQEKQLEEAEAYGAIPKEEADITSLVLTVKHFILQESIKGAIKQLKEDLEEKKRELEELKRGN